MRLAAAGAVVGLAGLGYRLTVRGALTLDVGVGRRIRPLGPVTRPIAAPPELVFDVIAEPYLGRTPRALAQKLDVWERGSDMALAAHFTPAGRAVATTVETVTFDRPAGRIGFRLVRGPVPHVVESFELRAAENGTSLTWQGELGTDLGLLGSWWADRVARAWENAVRASLEPIVAESERRAHASWSARAT